MTIQNSQFSSSNSPDWIAEFGSSPAQAYTAVSIMSFKRPKADDPDELIKHRFLCRGGALLLVGPTGIGKSSLSMQIMISFALGKSMLGLKPARTMKSLLIQAENDAGDLAEFRDGVIAGMDLTPEEVALVQERVLVATVDSCSGQKFCEEVVDKLLHQHMPDLLWIDPAFAYLGGDSNSAQDVGGFLRQGLNPLIHRHRCGLVLIHHTGKPVRAVNAAKTCTTDTAYSGSGSAEFANWSRATLTIEPVADGIFKLISRKRGTRLGWREPDGRPSNHQIVAHCKVADRVWWEIATDADVASAVVNGKPRPTPDCLMAVVPEVGSISLADLKEKARISGINEKNFGALRDMAVHSGNLLESSVSRPRSRPALFYSRSCRSQSAPLGCLPEVGPVD